ncbi:hypothetical protein ABZX90_31425 [Streptomyces sp. NPDC002935]|uniref:hypothetical protein n=1 Tax=Streptomyces sp. NPDC002935 TaxID=3154545 RepID=UPI0033B77FDC
MIVRRVLRLMASGALVAIAGLSVISIVEAPAQARVVAEGSADLPVVADQGQGESDVLNQLGDSSW